MDNNRKQIYNYTVLLEREVEGGYHAFCPTLKGCHSQGDTFEEAIENITEAIELYLESLKEDNQPIPQENLIVKPYCLFSSISLNHLATSQKTMTIEQLINQKVQQLPSNLKQEVLNFVEFLETKKEITFQEETISSDQEKGWDVFLNLEKDAVGSQHSDISDNHDSYLYSKE